MVRVERADVVTRLADPVRKHRCLAETAARFIGQFPREHSVGVAITRNDSFDVRLVHGLAFGRCVPLRIANYAARGKVGGHAPVIGPVVHKVDDELYSVFFCSIDYGVEALETICACVDRGGRSREGLEVYCAGIWNGFDVVETPYPEYFLARGG